MKKKRAYDAKNRRTAAEGRRRRILDVSKLLFSRHGIDRVTIAQIAARSGVAASTIYALFDSKTGILRALMHGALFDSAYEARAKKLLAIRDPIARLRATASVARSIYEGEAKDLGLLRGASAFSSDLRKVEREFEDKRYELQEERITDLHKQGLLPANMTIEQARHVMWMLTSRDVFRMLVGERGWTPAEYDRWLAQELVRTLTK